MKALLKKEFLLNLHPTAILFPFFAVFVFIPNYPYEVMFFFSGLSVFFICLTARENGDFAFTCAMPVKKRDVALARMVLCVILQAAVLFLAGISTMVKELCLPQEMQINLAGMMANFSFLGFGLILLGVFNVIFFPTYFKSPDKVGVPFLIAAAVQFAIIAALIVLRFSAPLFEDILNTPDPANIGAKTVVFFIGVTFYLCITVFAAWKSMRNFEKYDL